LNIKPDTDALNKKTITMTEELRYKLQKMIWDRFGEYVFHRNKRCHRQGGYDRYQQLWLDFLKKNEIEFIPGADAVHYKHKDFVTVVNPFQYGALKINKETAEKALVLGFFEHE
jgi:hypothetical protein